jgi:tubulin polyglutamylase TTLL4
VVTCYDPLKIYLFKEGLVRFATQKYNPKADSKYVHLTNYSVNKHNESYQAQSKWSLKQLQSHFTKIGVDYSKVMLGVKDVVIKTLFTAEPIIASSYNKCTKHRNICFEIYGFDILLDSNLKAWLLEVNISPSLSSSSVMDKTIKTVLICDTLNLVAV